MSSATGDPGRHRNHGRPKRVIFASSLGTVFEWYDFYLYATLAPFFAALFFPPGNATAALLASFVAYAAGFLVRPFGALVFGRIGDLVGRKYTFLDHDPRDGRLDGRRRPAADLRLDRLRGARAPAGPAPAPGSRARRRVRRRRHLRRRARPAGQAGPRHGLDPDDGDPRPPARPDRDRHLPRQDAARRVQELGLAHPVPDLARPARLLRLHPAQAAGVARSSRR